MSTPEKRKLHATISALIVAIGLMLMIGKMYADSEPGAIPLLLIVLGAVWHVIARSRARARHE